MTENDMVMSSGDRKIKIHKIKLVIAGFIALALSTGILINSVGQFILPINRDMGYSIGSISLAFSIIWGSVIFSATGVAKFINLYSPRICMGLSTAVLAAMTLTISFTNQIWQFYICTIIMGIFYTGLHTLPVSVMINEAFSEKKGMATSIAFAGTGIGGMVFNPFFNFIVGDYGWRNGFMIMALLYFIGGILIVWLVKAPKETIDRIEYMEIEVSENYSFDPDEKKHSQRQSFLKPLKPTKISDGFREETCLKGQSCKEAVKSKQFILLVIGVLISCGTGSATMMHTVPYMIDIGIKPSRASFLISLFLLILAVSKIILGIIIDKLGIKKGTLLGFCLYIPAVISLLMLNIFPFFYIIFLVIGGLGVSTATVTTPIITSYLFGNRDYTNIFGTTIIFNGIGNLTFPFLMGLLFDLTGSYVLGWSLIIVLLIVALLSYITIFRNEPKF